MREARSTPFFFGEQKPQSSFFKRPFLAQNHDQGLRTFWDSSGTCHWNTPETTFEFLCCSQYPPTALLAYTDHFIIFKSSFFSAMAHHSHSSYHITDYIINIFFASGMGFCEKFTCTNKTTTRNISMHFWLTMQESMTPSDSFLSPKPHEILTNQHFFGGGSPEHRFP